MDKKDKEIEATTKFKLYLNSIINTIDDNIHNELWNHLMDCVVYKEQLKRREVRIVVNIKERIEAYKISNSPESQAKVLELESLLKFIELLK